MTVAAVRAPTLADALAAEVERWAGHNLDDRQIDARGEIPAGVLADLAELGLLALTLPSTHGGMDLGIGEAAAVVRALARHDRSVATTVGLHLGLGTRGLVRYGTSDQHDRWVPDLASGRRFAAFAATEPGAGSDLAAVRTTVLQHHGRLRVSGAKVYVTNGGFAGLFTLLCASPGIGGARGQSVVLLTRGDAGVEIGAEEDKLGLRGSSTTTVHFDDVSIPVDRLLVGDGRTQAGHILSWGRTLLSAGCVGTADVALRLTANHTTTRRQFGRLLAELPVVQAQLADAAATRAAMQALVAHVAAAPDDDALLGRSIAAKVLCSEGAWSIVDLAVQLHGGSGYIEETGLALMLRDTRVTRIFEGANDVLRIHAGARLATRPGTIPTSQVAPLVLARREEAAVTFGVRLLRDARRLHDLGQAALLGEAVAAVEAGGLDPAGARFVASAERWLRAEPVIRDDDASVVDALLQEVCS